MRNERIFLLILAIFTVSLSGIFITIFYFNSQQVEAAPTTENVKAKVPTLTPTSTLTPARVPTINIPTSTPKITSAQNLAATPTEVLPKQQSVSESLLEQVNNFRKANGYSVVSSTPETCSFAQIRADEITTNLNHEGFTNRINNHTLPYTSYSIVIENIAFNSAPMEVVPQWINSPMHAENMKKNIQFACVGISGNYFVLEGFGF